MTPTLFTLWSSFLFARQDTAQFWNCWIKPVRSLKFNQLNFVFVLIWWQWQDLKWTSDDIQGNKNTGVVLGEPLSSRSFPPFPMAMVKFLLPSTTTLCLQQAPDLTRFLDEGRSACASRNTSHLPLGQSTISLFGNPVQYTLLILKVCWFSLSPSSRLGTAGCTHTAFSWPVCS